MTSMAALPAIRGASPPPPKTAAKAAALGPAADQRRQLTDAMRLERQERRGAFPTRRGLGAAGHRRCSEEVVRSLFGCFVFYRLAGHG